MDLYSLLPDLSLEELLSLAERENISVNSRISRCIVQSDIQRALNQRTGSDILAKFGPDPLGRQLAVEVGIRVSNNSILSLDTEKCWYIMSPLLTGFLHEQGVAYKFLSNEAIISAIASLVYERKLPVHQMLWYPPDAIHLIFMSPENYIKYAPFTDQTVEEILTDWNMIPYSSGLPMLHIQNLTDLIVFADSIPPFDVYFKTRRGCVDYINRWFEDEQTDRSDKLLQIVLFFKNVNQNYYPGRFELIKKASDNNWIFPTLYNVGYLISKLDMILAMPPVPSEEAYLKCLNQGFNPLDIFPLLRGLGDNVKSGFALHRAFQSDPKLGNVTREEIFQMYTNRLKAINKIPFETVFRIMGYEGIHYDDLYQTMKIDKAEVVKFRVIYDPKICPNPLDTLRQPFGNFVITYGNFLNFVCYSPEELLESFIVRDTFVSFRKPDRPQEVFTSKEVENLLDVLEIENHHEECGALINKIRQGLESEFPSDLSQVAESLSQLSSEDIQLAQGIFQSFFEAGMFQRTWSGTGPYPMTQSETSGRSLEEIEIKMTPILNDIQDRFQKLSLQGRRLIGSLSVIDYENGPIKRSDQLLDFEQMTREGQFCIGYGSRLMIYSGYFYLQALGVKIPGFRLEEFEPDSTHR